MIHVIVTIDVRPDRVGEFLALVAAHQEASRREPGCRRFEVGHRGNRFLLQEAFDDRAALVRHQLTPHYQGWRARISALEIAPRRHEEFEELAAVADPQQKIVTADILLGRLRARGLNQPARTVVTNGVFDLLGPHHLHHLRQCRAAGDVLIVAINSDDSTRRLKGEGRPVQREEERAAILANLELVDFVIVFHEDTPAELLDRLRPAVLAKDEGYRGQQIPGSALAGQVLFTKRLEGYSTTALLSQIRQAA